MSHKRLIRSPDTQRKNRIPPNQRLTEKLPVLHFGTVPTIDTSNWAFRIFGKVGKEVELDYQEFMSLPRVKVLSDVHCVTGWSRLDNLWEGVSAFVVRQLADIDASARFVMIHAAGGYRTNLSLRDFFETDVLLATELDGGPLTPEHGHPVRLVVPRLYFWKSAKWVTGVEFMEDDQSGFWESAGYHDRGDPWKEERYSSPLGEKSKLSELKGNS